MMRYSPKPESRNEGVMHKKLALLILLSYALVAQAVPDDAAPYIQAEAVKEPVNLVRLFNTAPRLKSAIAMIYDEQEQRPLYSKNADAIVPIASITKVMTAMVLLDAQLPLDEKISITLEDTDRHKGTHSRIKTGMILQRGELLKLALMASENRAAAALARTYPGGTAVTVAMMNAKAHNLGMWDTRFLDATGLNSANVSSAGDLVKMLTAAQRYDLIQMYSTTPSHIVATSGSRPLRFGNTNPLVKNASWNIDLSKTGYISEAGRCLVMKATIAQRPVIIVLLDSWGKSTRVGDANRIKKWMEASVTRARKLVRRS